VVATSTDPRLGEIRLAWWRERLDDLDTEGPPAGEPRLSGINRHLMPITNGAMLSLLPGAWAPLLYPFPWEDGVAQGMRERGKLLFQIGAQIIGSNSDEAGAPGAVWSLTDAAFHCSDPTSRDFLLQEERREIGNLDVAVLPELRPITVLAALSAHDALGRSRLSRGIAAFRHRICGTFPR